MPLKREGCRNNYNYNNNYNNSQTICLAIIIIIIVVIIVWCIVIFANNNNNNNNNFQNHTVIGGDLCGPHAGPITGCPCGSKATKFQSCADSIYNPFSTDKKIKNYNKDCDLCFWEGCKCR